MAAKLSALAFFATFPSLLAQSVNPLTIRQTSPDQFRLDWPAENALLYQMEGSLDLNTWVKIGPVVTGTGASQTMLVSKTTPSYFYKVSRGGIRSGFDILAMSRQDDHTYPEFSVPGIRGTALPVNLGFTVNFLGAIYSSCYVNNNGNITFSAKNQVYTPLPLRSLETDIIAAFWADVDTFNPNSGVTKFSSNGITREGFKSFGVTYENVGYFDNNASKLNTFQLILTERPDTGIHNFDVEFNYDKVLWESGTASQGKSARAGFSRDRKLSMELAGSGIPSSFLDSKLSPTGQKIGLKYRSFNTNTPGRFIFRFRDGGVENSFYVDAGSDQSLAESHDARIQLSSSISSPLPGVSYLWKLKNGPAPVNFSDATSATTLATLNEPGIYEFEVIASNSSDDMSTTSTDNVIVSHPASFLSIAGGFFGDIPLSPPDSFHLTLNGVAEFSGGTVNIAWTQTAGAPATMTDITTLTPGITLPGPGEYKFRMTATTNQTVPFVQTSEVNVIYFDE